MSNLEDKAVDIMDKAMIGAEKLSAKLAELATQYGPDVVDAALQVARFKAAGELLAGTVSFVIAYNLAKFSKRMFSAAAKRRDEFNKEKTSSYYTAKKDISEFEEFFAGVASALLAVFLTIPTIITYGSIWNWVGIIEPKLWIANRILEKAL